MGNHASLECCVHRGHDKSGGEEQPWNIDRHHSWQSIPESEEFLTFLDCEEIPPTPNKQACKTFMRKGTYELVQSISEADEMMGQSPVRATSSAMRTKAQEQEDALYEHSLHVVIDRVREAWWKRIDAASEEDGTELIGNESIRDGPELNDWTEEHVVRRMLRGALGNEEQAVQMLLKAITCRVRDRQLYKKLRCEVVCDARVIGRDREGRPVVYTCAYSQNAPLKEMAPQVCLAMEAAVLLSKADGQVGLVVDMYKFKTGPNMDATSLRLLSDTLGSVFAERFHFMLIVDFSFLAQGVWTMIKPTLSEKTKKKVNFVSEGAARKIVEERLAPATSQRILASFDINRDPLSNPEEREEHARKTSICNVPFGG